MKHWFLFIFVLPNLVFAQTVEGPRPALVTEGSRLLNDETTAEDFVKWARELRQQREFNAEEQNYLKSLSRKLAAPQASQICSSAPTSLCQGTSLHDERRPPEQNRAAEVAESVRIKDDDSPSGISKGWFVAGVLLVGGYLALKDKEVQVQWRSGAW